MTNETRPPKEYDKIVFHWVESERSSGRVCCQWIKGWWHSPGVAGAITPAEMYRRGWTYYAPALVISIEAIKAIEDLFADGPLCR
jgi:hypothetical protein